MLQCRHKIKEDINLINDEISKVLKQRSLLHIENDFEIEKCREKLIKLLSQNEFQTINFLDNCGKDEALWISEVFEEVAYNLQSEEYIKCLKRLDKKFSDLNLTDFVKTAVEFMDL